MKKLITITLVSGLLFGAAGVSFAQIMFGPSSGYYRVSDKFTDVNSGRVLNGINLNFDFSHYNKKVPIGIYSKIYIAGLANGYEWKGSDQIKGITDGYPTDFGLFLAPSFKFKLGDRVELPLSLGPSFRWNIDRNYYYYYDDDGYYESNNYYESINLGIMGEAALLVYPIEWFYIKFGVNGDYDFLRAEQGSMYTEYRKKTITRFKKADYNAFILSVFMGVGFRFE